jgi:integrase
MLDKIEDQNGAKMADLTLAYIRKILNWHTARVDDFNSPIARGMSRYDAKANEGTRILSDDELRKLWQATEPNEKAPQPFHALFRFLLLTGARRDEARELPRNEIKGTDWILPAARHKNKTELTRPLSKAAQAVLAGVPVIDGGALVFTNDGQRPVSLSTPFVKLAAETGTSGWRLHDVRRTARTLLSRAGVNSDVAERCLGHTIGGVRGIYDKHTFHAEMLAAYEKLATLIENIVNPDERVVLMQRSG